MTGWLESKTHGRMLMNTDSKKIDNQTTFVPTVNGIPITINWVDRYPRHAFSMIKQLAGEVKRMQMELDIERIVKDTVDQITQSQEILGKLHKLLSMYENHAVVIQAAAEHIKAQDTRIEAMEKALQEMIYETTHLSSESDDGSHMCKIGKKTLQAARAAIEKN